MKIVVCIGSACHLKDSRIIVDRLQQMIYDEKLSEKIELEGSLCMGNCCKGVCVTVDGQLHTVDPENIRDFFDDTVKPKL